VVQIVMSGRGQKPEKRSIYRAERHQLHPAVYLDYAKDHVNQKDHEHKPVDWEPPSEEWDEQRLY
jgi:hypothetical protein